MDRTQYDTKEGIAAVIATSGLAGLRAIMEARHALVLERHAIHRQEDRDCSGKARSREEHLTSFVVLSRFYLGDGSVARVNRDIVTDADRAAAPPVMTWAEWDAFWQPIFARAPRDPRRSSPFGGHEDRHLRFPIPPAHVVCAMCENGGWTLEACHNIEGDKRREEHSDSFGPMALDQYVGRTLRDVRREETEKRTDGDIVVPMAIRNDRWAKEDQRITKQEPRWARDMGWRGNFGWGQMDEEETIDWDYVVQAGDMGAVAVYHYYHASCWTQHIAQSQPTAPSATPTP